MTSLQIACLALLALMLLAAAVCDLKARIIPNRLNLAIALLALPWWLASGLDPAGVAVQLGLSVAVFALFALLFSLGLIGGGDVKLLAALALWLPLGEIAALLVWMALLGGVLALVVLAWSRLRPSAAAPQVPYGIAIVAAALPIITNRILTI